MYESPSPATSQHCLWRSHSTQAYQLSNFPCPPLSPTPPNFPPCPFQGLCSRHGPWNPGPWGLLTELGWGRVRNNQRCQVGLCSPPRISLANEFSLRLWGAPHLPMNSCRAYAPVPTSPLRPCLQLALAAAPVPYISTPSFPALGRRLHLCMLYSYKLCNFLDTGRCM